MNTPSTPAMDDTPTVPSPPGAVEAVLAAHEGTYITDDHVRCACGAAKPSGWGFSPVQHRAHVAQALVDAGCVLGDDWDVETRVEWGVEREGAAFVGGAWLTRLDAEARCSILGGFVVHRTVTTATRTTAWKEAE